MERTEAELIAATLKGDAASFAPLVQKYSPRVFATARRYARRLVALDPQDAQAATLLRSLE